ncbi:MAG: carbohydrate kinase [Selenomonadaceae bacterium]|nr:carbohydrate kinase [Selenomonadaceae bacterium]
MASKFRTKRILVVGDMIADVYLNGRIARVSREAPVLVLEEIGKKVVAGGAANVVSNLAELGGDVYAVGMVGDDFYGEELKNTLKRHKVHVEGIVTDKTRPTISKTRVIAGGRATVNQQVVRIDKEDKEPLSKKMEAALIAKLDKLLPNIEGIVLSDYGSNTITRAVKTLVINFAGKHKIPNIVDSRYNIGDYEGVGFVKQNDSELAAFVGREITDMTSLISAGSELLRKLNSNGILITRGESGMSLFERGGAVHHIPVSDRSEVFDVSGAGDTCVAAFILGLTANFTPVVAARIANYAAGIAVRKLGTSTVSIAELMDVLDRAQFVNRGY